MQCSVVLATEIRAGVRLCAYMSVIRHYDFDFCLGLSSIMLKLVHYYEYYIQLNSSHEAHLSLHCACQIIARLFLTHSNVSIILYQYKADFILCSSHGAYILSSFILSL